MAGLLAVVACSDLTDTEQVPRARLIPEAPSQDLLPGSGACTNCVYGPRVLSKAGPSARGFDGAFDADPAADYMLVVKSSDPTARVEAWLNGVKVMSRGALELAAGKEATAQLTVKSKNILQFVLYGSAGVKATVGVVLLPKYVNGVAATLTGDVRAPIAIIDTANFVIAGIGPD
ncbi:MAG TPA: hypothetical protein VFV33_07015, partial [Gemmatimonadaceae bacterium]|nr:hypothetical protein [Gemmatimonadaceae bacterium]